MPNPWDELAVRRDRTSGESGDLWRRALIDPCLRDVLGSVRGLPVPEIR